MKTPTRASSIVGEGMQGLSTRGGAAGISEISAKFFRACCEFQLRPRRQLDQLLYSVSFGARYGSLTL
ncbi:hypothetical protein PNOK_0416100 [Pyrrhoderma noxium]|uniref:Uncharacterized protein n=1 Tax=Pyrrhoderma noxium TaxID=2282107 RepID=A0A286UI54_9AGAM|nr:hypothetical protein PNOK_0416100 [Pyrrhoderma noxium]